MQSFILKRWNKLIGHDIIHHNHHPHFHYQVLLCFIFVLIMIFILSLSIFRTSYLYFQNCCYHCCESVTLLLTTIRPKIVKWGKSRGIYLIESPDIDMFCQICFRIFDEKAMWTRQNNKRNNHLQQHHVFSFPSRSFFGTRQNNQRKNHLQRHHVFSFPSGSFFGWLSPSKNNCRKLKLM